MITREPFKISDYTEFLTESDIPGKRAEKKKICPNCGEHQLSINKDGIKYTCYSCYDHSEIAKILIQLHKEKYGEIPMETKTERKAQTREWTYKDKEGNERIKVKRVDSPEGKKIYQYSLQDNQWVPGLKGVSQSEVTPLYYDQLNRNEKTFIVEGEGCADALRELGLQATTNIGGSGKNTQVYELLREFKDIVICPDRDVPGIKHGKAISLILPQAKWLYCYPDSPLWINLPNNGGRDVVDWINELRKQGKSSSQIKQLILDSISEEKINKQKLEQTYNNSPNEPNPQQAFSEIDNLLLKNVSFSQAKKEIAIISRHYGIYPQELERYYKQKKSENELSDLSQSELSDIGDILLAENQSLDLIRVLPQYLSTLITDMASKMCVTPEHLFTAMLPALATGIGNKSRIIISNHGYIQPAIIRSMIIGKSGDRKSPILYTALAGIEELELQNRQAYREKMSQYEEEKDYYEAHKKDKDLHIEKPIEPIEQRFLIKDFNYEGMLRVHSENSQGLLGVIDELKGYFARMNKQSGRGDDEQKDLELFNGKAISKDRMSKECSYYIPCSNVSLLGTIQWDILTQLISQKGVNDSSGTICRWLMCAKPMPPAYLNILNDHDPIFDDLKIIQQQIFLGLRGLPETDYILSPAAKKIWMQFQHKLEDMRQCETNEALAVAYPKFESYLCRIALVLHCLESLFISEYSPSISSETMLKAIEVTSFYISQYKYVLAKASPSQSMSGDLLKIRDLLLRKGSLTPSTVKNNLKHLRTVKNSDELIKSYFKSLVENNIAEWCDVTRSVKIQLNKLGNKLGNEEQLKPSQDITPTTELGQVRTKLGNSKSSQDNGHSTELGKIEEINIFSALNQDTETTELKQNTNTDTSSSQLENEEINNNGTDSIFPNLSPEPLPDNDLTCPNSFRTCPNLSPEPSQDKECSDLDFPNSVPNLQNRLDNICDYRECSSQSFLYCLYGASELSKIDEEQVFLLKGELTGIEAEMQREERRREWNKRMEE